MAKAKKPQTQERIEELEDLRAVVSTPQGFRFLKRLIGVTGPFRSNFNESHAIHSFLDGQKNVGSKLLADLCEASPENAIKLIVATTTNKKQEEAKDVLHETEQDDETAAD